MFERGGSFIDLHSAGVPSDTVDWTLYVEGDAAELATLQSLDERFFVVDAAAIEQRGERAVFAEPTADDMVGNQRQREPAGVRILQEKQREIRDARGADAGRAAGDDRHLS